MAWGEREHNASIKREIKVERSFPQHLRTVHTWREISKDAKEEEAANDTPQNHGEERTGHWSGTFFTKLPSEKFNVFSIHTLQRSHHPPPDHTKRFNINTA